MEIKVLESSSNLLVFQLIGADHTLCNSLKKELIGQKDVEVATYAIEHPQVGIPKFHIETIGKTAPKKVLQEAIKSLKELNATFSKNFK